MKLPAFSKIGSLASQFCSSYVANFPSFVCILFLILAIVTWVRLLAIRERLQGRSPNRKR
jgi:hypothetical protein